MTSRSNPSLRTLYPLCAAGFSSDLQCPGRVPRACPYPYASCAGNASVSALVPGWYTPFTTRKFSTSRRETPARFHVPGGVVRGQHPAAVGKVRGRRRRRPRVPKRLLVLALMMMLVLALVLLLMILSGRRRGRGASAVKGNLAAGSPSRPVDTPPRGCCWWWWWWCCCCCCCCCCCVGRPVIASRAGCRSNAPEERVEQQRAPAAPLRRLGCVDLGRSRVPSPPSRRSAWRRRVAWAQP